MPLTRAILVNPPSPPGYVSNKDSMGGFGQLYPRGAPPFPPLDLPHLAAHLLAHGRPVEVVEAGALDLTVDGLASALAAVAAGPADMVLLRTSLPTIDFDLGVAAHLRRHVRPGAVGLYGPVVEPLRFRIERDPDLDFAVIGEPDDAVLQLLGGTPPGDIPGLLHRGPDGTWRLLPARPFADDLDARPLPRWDLLPYERYIIPRSSTTGQKRFLPMLTSRGCPYGCSYCPYPVGQGLKWRYRSPASVVYEMEHLVERYRVEYILFRDPMFSLRQGRVVEICEEILRRRLAVEWKCETRVDCLDEPTVAAMARAGCTGINFGIESTDPVIQKGVHRKPILAEEFVAKVALCHRHGIKTFAFFVVGLPGDTVDTILASIDFATRIKPTWIQFTVATPFIGTALHEWAVGHGLIDAESYRIVSSHVGAMGNENLSAAQVARLHHFAQFLQSNLINRRGLLKNEGRRDLPYRLARSAADRLLAAAARAYSRLGSWYFRRAYAGTAPPAAPPVRA